MQKKSLHVNLDHVATLRQQRKEIEPSLIDAVKIVQEAGASGVTVHLREDRRHIQDADVYALRQIDGLHVTLEMAATAEMANIAKRVSPNLITLVPEKREELTTEGGLNIIDTDLGDYIADLQSSGLKVSLFIEPEENIIQAAHDLGARCIELHTGTYANAIDKTFQIERLKNAAKYAASLGMQVNAGHGLSTQNLTPILDIPEISELHIGFSIIARSVFIGLDGAVREIRGLIS